MSHFIKQIVKTKLKQLSSDELLHYAQQYGFSLTKAQANQITNYLKQNSLDPFNEKDRKKMFRELATITDDQTAKKAQDLLNKLIKENGLEYLFD